MELPGPFLRPSPKKQKKISQKKFLTFSEIEFSSSNIKKILIFSQKKSFLYFQKWNPALFGLSPPNVPLKIPLLKKIHLFSQEKAFIIFLEMEPRTFQSKLEK